jgi:hypothetical protein
VEYIVLTQIVGSHAIVHPWTVVVHTANATIANTAMMGHGWFKGLALPTHRVRVFHQSLAFAGNRRQGHTARICEGSLGMAGQRHETQDIVDHSQHDRDAFRDGQQGDSHGRVHQQQPDQSGHDGTSLIGTVEPNSILYVTYNQNRMKIEPLDILGRNDDNNSILADSFINHTSLTLSVVPNEHDQGSPLYESI